jgi:Putative amidoligase enzyme
MISTLIITDLFRIRHRAGSLLWYCQTEDLPLYSAPQITMTAGLTFGVELEFLVATLPDDEPNPCPQDPKQVHGFYGEGEGSNPRLQNAIVRALQGVGLPAFQQDTVVVEPERDGRWLVTTDITVFGLVEDSRYSWEPIEVQSPPYPVCRESLEKIKLACQTLTSNFHLVVNSTCGLHVHIGVSDFGIPVHIVRKLIAFLYCFEPQINAIHPQHRHQLHYTLTLRNNTTLEAQYYRKEGRKMSSKLVIAWILSAPSLPVLIDGLQMSSGGTSAYYMGNLLPPKLLLDTARITAWEGEQPVQWKKRTIEFRQHEGTLDSDSVAAWVMTVAGLVEYAQNVDDTALEELLAQHLALERNGNEGSYGIVQLLKDIGLENPAAFYEKRLGDYNARQERARKSSSSFKAGNPAARP